MAQLTSDWQARKQLWLLPQLLMATWDQCHDLKKYSRRKICRKGPYFLKMFVQKLDHNIGFQEKMPIFFSENRQKMQKIVIV
jgi:hypothetical protein